MTKIFISYRRSDSQWQTKQLYEALAAELSAPEHDIFYDLDSMKLGFDFRQRIDEAVSKCDVLVAVIGGKWITEIDPETGVRRIDQETDLVRIEIASALKRNIQVVPLLLDGTKLPREEELPEDLRALSYRHAAKLRVESFDNDFQVFVGGLQIRKSDSKSSLEQSAIAKSRSSERKLFPKVLSKLEHLYFRQVLPMLALCIAVVLGALGFVFFSKPGSIFSDVASSPELLAQEPASEEQQIDYDRPNIAILMVAEEDLKDEKTFVVTLKREIINRLSGSPYWDILATETNGPMRFAEGWGTSDAQLQIGIDMTSRDGSLVYNVVTKLIHKDGDLLYSDIFFLQRPGSSVSDSVVEQIAAKLESRLINGLYPAHVAELDDEGSFIVSGGNEYGFQVGDILEVKRLSREPVLRKIGIEISGKSQQIGQIRLTDVREDIAYAELVVSSKEIKLGDLVSPSSN